MSELGRLLELLHGAHRDVDSVFLEVHDWGLPEKNDPVAVVSDSAGTIRIQWPAGGGPTATATTATRRVWFQQPDRVRVEVLRGDAVTRAAVRDGASWWRWDQRDGESAGDLARGNVLPQLLELPLLRPARLIQAMWLEVAGIGSRAGREVLIATGTPRDSVLGATQRRELEFDVEHGTQLRTATYSGDECIATTEVTSVNYSPTIHPNIFSFAALENYRPWLPASRVAASSVNPLEQQVTAFPRAQLTERATVWLTGLSGAGKSTIARTTERLLNQLGIPCCTLDGDQLRLGLSADLGLSRGDRREQARRVAHVAATLADSGVIPIVALVSPYAEDRERARQIHHAAGLRFVEVWVDTPLEICAARDAKGLYAAAQVNGSTSDGSGLTGLTSPYEAPTHPDLRISGHEQHPRILASQILEKVFGRPTPFHASTAQAESRTEVER